MLALICQVPVAQPRAAATCWVVDLTLLGARFGFGCSASTSASRSGRSRAMSLSRWRVMAAFLPADSLEMSTARGA